MAYQETTTTGYGSRVKSSFGGILTGFLMLIGATILIWWNEGRAVGTADMLADAQKNTTHIENIDAIDPSVQGKLIHACGQAKTTETLSDPTFGVNVNAIKLERRVEYYQWEENRSSKSEDKLGGSKETTTTYTYSQGWSAKPVNSANFKDPEYKGISNAVVWNGENKSQTAQKVTFGAYQLPPSMVSSISGSAKAPITISADVLRNLDKQVAKIYQTYGRTVPDNIGQPETGEYNPTFVHVGEGTVYLGADEFNPQVGDVKIELTFVPSMPVSVLGVPQGGTFTNYTTDDGDTFSKLSVGTKSLKEMYADSNSGNKMMLWALRVLGLILCVSGFRGIFGILTTLAKVVPFIATIANFGVSLVSGILGFAWAFVVAAIAWLFYRPILSICLLAIAGAAIWYFFFYRKKNGAAAPAEAPSSQNTAEPVAPQQ